MPERLSQHDLTEQLRNGLLQLGEDPKVHPLQSYLDYIDLLEKWNRTYNLTGIKQKEKILTHHIFDSLSVLPYINRKHCLDIGSGAGLPGLILAMAQPDIHWVLLDSNRKKTRFLNQAVLELKLDNIEVITSRAEDYHPEQQFALIISRALMSLVDFYRLTVNLLMTDSMLLAMKGNLQQDEMAELEKTTTNFTIKELSVPCITATRNLVIFHKA